MGRPSIYSSELATAICDRIAEGESLASICRSDGMPAAPTVRRWITEDLNGFAALSTRAYALGYEALAEECLEIADDGTNDWMARNGKEDEPGWVANGEHIQRSRLRIDTRMRLLGKWASKRYGDKVSTEVTGADGSPLMLSLDDPSLAQRLAFMLMKATVTKAREKTDA